MAHKLLIVAALVFLGVNAEEGEDCTCTADYDSDGYRLVLRHTSNEVTLDDFFKLYKYGLVGGCRVGSLDSSQFKDPYLAFYWGDVTGVRLDSFDLEGEKKTSIYLNMTQAVQGEKVTWSNVLHNRCPLIATNEDKQSYLDINTACAYNVLYNNKDDCNTHALTFATSDACDSQNVWFHLQGKAGSGICDWEDSIREKTIFHPEYTVAFYNSFPVAMSNEMTLRPAGKFEIRITGSFVPLTTSDTNGFCRVFRYPSYAGVHIMDYFESGINDPSLDRSELNAPFANTWDMYRADDMLQQLEGAGEVLFVVYDQSGLVDQVMSFSGSGDHLSWFNEANLKSSLHWDMPADQTYDYFDIAIKKRTKLGRYFIINEFSEICDTDKGFFLVSCKRDNGWTGCEYEYMAGEETNDFVCMIQYTPTGKPTIYSQHRKIGSAIEIFVKPKQL